MQEKCVKTDCYCCGSLAAQIGGWMMKQYRFFTGPDDAAFCQRVTDALNQGWQLYGSPTLTFDGQKVIAGQAVVRETNDTPENDGSDPACKLR